MNYDIRYMNAAARRSGVNQWGLAGRRVDSMSANPSRRFSGLGATTTTSNLPGSQPVETGQPGGTTSCEAGYFYITGMWSGASGCKKMNSYITCSDGSKHIAQVNGPCSSNPPDPCPGQYVGFYTNGMPIGGCVPNGWIGTDPLSGNPCRVEGTSSSALAYCKPKACAIGEKLNTSTWTCEALAAPPGTPAPIATPPILQACTGGVIVAGQCVQVPAGYSGMRVNIPTSILPTGVCWLNPIDSSGRNYCVGCDAAGVQYTVNSDGSKTKLSTVIPNLCTTPAPDDGGGGGGQVPCPTCETCPTCPPQTVCPACPTCATCPTCPTGQVWDFSLLKCVDYSSCTSGGRCNPKTPSPCEFCTGTTPYYDPVSQTCVAKPPPVQIPGPIQYVDKPTPVYPTCTTGYWNTGTQQCASLPAPVQLPPVQVPVDKFPTCSNGLLWDTNTRSCVPPPKPIEVQVPVYVDRPVPGPVVDKWPECPEGFLWDDDNRICVEIPTAPPVEPFPWATVFLTGIGIMTFVAGAAAFARQE